MMSSEEETTISVAIEPSNDETAIEGTTNLGIIEPSNAEITVERTANLDVIEASIDESHISEQHLFHAECQQSTSTAVDTEPLLQNEPSTNAVDTKPLFVLGKNDFQLIFSRSPLYSNFATL